MDGSDASSGVVLKWHNAAGAHGNYSVVYNVNIPSGADLNNYKITGHYMCSTAAVAATVLNCPVSGAFSLTVTRSGADMRCIQTVQYGIQKYTRYDDGGGWSLWWQELIAAPGFFYVGPTREIQNLTQLQTRLQQSGISREIIVYFDDGQYSTADGSGIQLTSLGRIIFRSVSQDASKVTISSPVTIVSCLRLGFQNLTLPTTYIYSGGHTDIIGCSFNDGMLSLNCCGFTTVRQCSFYKTSGACLHVLNGVLSTYDLTFSGSFSTAITASHAYVALHNTLSVSNARYVTYVTDSYVNSTNTKVTLTDITNVQLYAQHGSNVYIAPTTAVTRSGTTASVVSSPAKNTVGNQNSYVTYSDNWYS